MSQIRKNIVANYAGSFWALVMSLIFIPVYIKFMGIESYGLVGFLTSVNAVFGLLDMGLRTTINREMARLSGLAGNQQKVLDTARTLEIIYWIVAASVCLVIVAFSPFIAKSWVNPELLSVETIQQAAIIMGFVVAIRWPFAFYQGGLVGLQRQVLLNAITAGCGTLRGVGTVMVLWLISPTIQAFLLWQIVTGALETLLGGFFFWRTLPKSTERPGFKKEVLLRVRGFSAGMFGISVVTLILTQADKIILSKILPLNMFGYYTLAWSIASALVVAITPIQTALFPIFCELVSEPLSNGVTAFYHKSCQLVSVVLLPSALILALFSPEILSVWTRDPVTVENTSSILRLLVIGTGLNGLLLIPYNFQLAHGWTSLALATNIVSVIILVPATILLSQKYGSVGAAMVWVILNGGYLLISAQIMFRRLLPGEQWRWYLHDLGLPAVAALMVAGIGRQVMPGEMSLGQQVAFVGATFGLSLIATTIAASEIRRRVVDLFMRRPAFF